MGVGEFSLLRVMQSQAASPVFYKRVDWVNHGQKASKHHSSVASASVSTFRFMSCLNSCPGFPWWRTVIRMYRPNRPTFPQVPFGHGLNHSYRNLTKTLCLAVKWTQLAENCLRVLLERNWQVFGRLLIPNSTTSVGKNRTVMWRAWWQSLVYLLTWQVFNHTNLEWLLNGKLFFSDLLIFGNYSFIFWGVE